jgi:hypothetical protein
MEVRRGKVIDYDEELFKKMSNLQVKVLVMWFKMTGDFDLSIKRLISVYESILHVAEQGEVEFVRLETELGRLPNEEEWTKAIEENFKANHRELEKEYEGE